MHYQKISNPRSLPFPVNLASMHKSPGYLKLYLHLNKQYPVIISYGLKTNNQDVLLSDFIIHSHYGVSEEFG